MFIHCSLKQRVTETVVLGRGVPASSGWEAPLPLGTPGQESGQDPQVCPLIGTQAWVSPFVPARFSEWEVGLLPASQGPGSLQPTGKC